MRRVLVTGGGSGIGAATCAELTKRGWDPVPADLRPPEGGVTLDVTDERGWVEVFDSAGPFDGLVNSAGIRTRHPLVDLAVEEFERVVRVNLVGTFLGVREAFRRWMPDGRPGVIVNLASVNAFLAVPNQVHYAASKAGVVMLTKAAAREAADSGVRVNAVAPGPVRTPMIEERLADPAQEAWLRDQVPMGRIAEPDEVARVIAFLLSDEASYVTGTTMFVDGGWVGG
jgi:NAD(P)-dependent dehydrogenase (short-subunit alcohol dehydrogenase family)